MSQSRKRYGAAGEQAALDYLDGQGLTLLGRNLATPFGEIDLLMEEDGVRAVIEVKARRRGSHGAPQEAVTADKLKHITQAAEHYFQSTGYIGPWRVDIVAVSDTRVEHFRNVTLA